MFNKKKTGGASQTEAATPKAHSKHKNYSKKHSRGPSIECVPMDMGGLILKQFRQSSKQMNQHQLLFNMDSLLSSNGSSFAVSTKETILNTCPRETLTHYFVFSKHQQPTRTSPSIEFHLVQLIRSRYAQHPTRPFPHFQAHIYPIVRKHLLKTRRLRRKLMLQEGQVGQHKPSPQDLPTAFSEEEDARANELGQKKGRSDSFELRALTECIQQMFSKQTQDRNPLGISINCEHSWLGPNHNESKKQFIDCDFSSIEAHSKFDLLLESKGKFKDSQMGFTSNYGLQDLKRKYDDFKIAQLCENQQELKHLGHKRNPTDVAPDKNNDFYGNPLTPKQQAARSEFGSSDNLPLEPAASSKKKAAKQKSKQVYEPYMLKFDRKKVQKKEVGARGAFKENLKSERKKSRPEEWRSKSRSSKKGSVIQSRKKRLQAEL